MFKYHLCDKARQNTIYLNGIYNKIRMVNKKDIKEFLKPDLKKVIVTLLFLLTFFADVCLIENLAEPMLNINTGFGSGIGGFININLPFKETCTGLNDSPFRLAYLPLIIISYPAHVISTYFSTSEIIRSIFMNTEVNAFTFAGIPLITHLIYWYLLSCLIFWIKNKYRKKN